MLLLAIESVKNKKCTSYDAEKQFGIPRRTIDKRIKNLHSDKPGPRFRLSSDEENQFVKVLIAAGDFGCPLSQLDFKLTVWDYLKKNNKTYIFNDKPPGDWWVRNFLQRYKDQLTLRSTQNITKARAEKTLEEFEEYFLNLEISLRDIPPSNIMNYDETNVSDDPGSTKSIFRRGIKYPERIINHSKGCISLMFAATAEGELLPPYVVYKSENLWSEWCRGGPEGARYNRSKSGWFDSVAFLDWFKTIVIPWASKIDGQKLIIGDNLSSHLNADVVELCEAYQIRFAFLPPRSTQLTQPLDVAFFGPLKKSWRTILLKYKTENPKQVSLNKTHFPLLLNQLMEAANLKKQNILSGFKATGIHPFNPYEVYKKLPEYKDNIKYDVDQTLLDYLKQNKQPNPITKGKNTKLNVPSGKSISSSDITPLTTNKTTATKRVNETKNTAANSNSYKARPDRQISGLKRPRKANIVLAKKSYKKKQKSRDDSSDSDSSCSVPSCETSEYDPKDDEDAAIDLEEWLDEEVLCSQEIHGITDKHSEEIANIEHKIVPGIDLEAAAKGEIIDNIHHEDLLKNKVENNKDNIDNEKVPREKNIIVILSEQYEKDSEEQATEDTKKETGKLKSNVREVKNSERQAIKNSKETERVKVTILSDVKNTAENRSYFDLHNYGPITLKPINKNLDLVVSKIQGKEEVKKISGSRERKNTDPIAGCSFKPDTINTISYHINDYILVRYIFKKRVQYFVGKIIAKVGNKYEVSFYKRCGKNDNTRFIQPNKIDTDMIDEGMIVKQVQLVSLSPREKEFVFFEDDDLVYFD